MGTIAPTTRPSGGPDTSVETSTEPRRLHISTALRLARTPEGRSLEALSRETPVLVVFVRHLGCTFCREALDDLREQRAAIEADGTRIAIVHMGHDEQAASLFAAYGLDDVDRVSDPDAEIYRAFGLRRGRGRALFGPRIVWRALKALFGGGHGAGWPVGDPLRLPGVFLVRDGAILRAFRHETVADRPSYCEIARHGADELDADWLDDSAGSERPQPAGASS